MQALHTSMCIYMSESKKLKTTILSNETKKQRMKRLENYKSALNRLKIAITHAYTLNRTHTLPRIAHKKP